MPKTEEKVFLIVDRSGVHQKMLGRLVESVGGRAVSVRDYDEARVTLRNIRPEAIILDIRSDTQEVELFLDSLSSERRTPVPVIAVCNVVDQGLVQTLNKYGVAEILVKPIVIQRLHRAIQNIFHDRRPGQDTDETETSPTILLIEDFTITAKSYASVLERAGYQILLARTAEIAYELVVRHHPDFMLLDVILPGMNGVEFAQLLQSRRLEIPFAAVTVCKDQSKLHELQRLGALKIFHKPVEGEALLGFVNGFFSSQRGRSHEDISYDVLLAIPDQVAGNIVRQALDEVGIRHKLVTDGYQAFAELQLCPAIAVIDIVLGGLDGAEIIRRLREHPPSHHRTCIIALADEMDDELRAELQDLGADDSLGKPISLSELIYKIQKLSTGGRDVKPADYASAFLRQIRSLPDTESPDFFTAAATLGHDMMGTTTVISNNRLSELAQRLNDAALRGHAREVANFLGQVCSELTKLTQASESARQV